MTITYRVVSDRSAWSESGEGLVVLDLQDSNYLSLNGSAATLWRCLADGPSSPIELENALRAVYDVQEHQAKNDVSSFLAQLVARGLVAEHAAP